MILRFLLLVAVVVAAWGIVWLSERVRGRGRGGLDPGVVLVTAEGCSLCGPAESALRSAGLTFRTVDASDATGFGVRSVPTVFLVGSDGSVRARRSGRAAIMTPAELAGWN